MNILRKWLVFLLICLMILPYSVYAADIGPSGNCGENLSWTLDLDGTLTISGTGAMTNFGPSYAENVSVPWYGNRADIKAVVIEQGVTSIGNNAFVACSNLTTVTMPNSITRIGEHAFKNCSNLVKADIPAFVTEIGEYGFSGCKALTEVTIPNGVTTIADYSFETCISLKKIHIPESVTSIGRNAFKYCPSLTEIVLPESITFIGRTAFEECENLGHILYRGTQEQWASVTVRYGAIADHMVITYNYKDGMEYHVFQNDCTAKCTHCSFTREADHSWDEGVDNGEVEPGKYTVTFTCTVCGETRVDVTLVDPPVIPTEPTSPVTRPSVSPTTVPDMIGDSAPAPDADKTAGIAGYIAVLVLLAAVAVVIIVRKKK